jgi:hypothetical protein
LASGPAWERGPESAPELAWAWAPASEWEPGSGSEPGSAQEPESVQGLAWALELELEPGPAQGPEREPV